MEIMIKKVVILIIFFLCVNIKSQETIKNIEPPFWWVGLENCKLQLMLYGNDIAKYEPTLNYKNVKIDSVKRTDNPNYLFVFINIAKEAEAGIVKITLKNNNAEFSFNYELKLKNKQFKPNPVTASDAVYLITPDRFVNGNKANDSIEGYFEKADRSNIKFRHGGDIAGIKSKLDFIKEMGFTAIWPMPMLQSNMPIYSYHGYSITNYYNIDPRYGSNEEYLDLIKESHKKGIKVIQDMVFNQFGDTHFWTKDLPSKDWVHVWPEFTYSNFDGTVLPDPHSSEYDKNRMTHGWFDKWMPDLNQENPLVANYLIQNTIWWVEYAGIDGIRMDTYQYNYKECMNEWIRRIKTEYPDLFIVGEVWMNYPEIISYWKKGTVNHDGFKSELESITDFPIQATLAHVFTGQQSIYELYKVISRDFLYKDPKTNLIFADNHDVTRFFSYTEKDINKYKQIITFLATTRGIPQIYYGTEILMTGHSHEEIRADYPGGWEEDSVDAFTANGRTELQNEAYEFLVKLFKWRKSQEVIHSGNLIHFIPYNNTYVYFRENEKNCVLVAINNSNNDVELEYDRHKEILNKYSSGKNVITDENLNDLKKIIVKARNEIVVELYKN